jgi:glycosyltransferase involved in cell wall biosynthesis
MGPVGAWLARPGPRCPVGARCQAKQMNVLWLTNMWPDSQRPWYGSFVYSQARSLERIGVDLDVLYVPGYRSSREYARGAGEVLRRSKRRQYDLVHAHYGHSGLLARLQRKAPVLLSYCGDDLLGTPKSDGVGLTRRSIVLARAFAQLSHVLSATITKSEEMELRLPPSSRKRNNVIPNGVDLSKFEPIQKDVARSRLGWSGKSKNLLFVGNPDFPRKNVRLAEAVRDELLQRGIQVELRIAWQVEPDMMTSWMAASDVLLFTSLFEGSPNTVKEAMAMELPIVSASVGDVPERLRNIEGTFVTERNREAMADSVELALEHDHAPAARVAIAELSIESVAERVLTLYRSLVAL